MVGFFIFEIATNESVDFNAFKERLSYIYDVSVPEILVKIWQAVDSCFR